MKNVRFDNSGASPVFRFTGADGTEDWIEFKPSIDGLWSGLDIKNFSVELLINPILNRAKNVYNLRKDDGTISRVGMVFPVSALDSDDSFEQTGMCNYAFVAFQTLLERLEDVNNPEGDFSENFEDNVCVCVFNLKSTGFSNPLPLCINSLRKYGYSYFMPNNKIQAVDGFKAELYVNDNISNLAVRFEEPKLYQNPVVDLLLRALPHANNVIHRFVLLYQVIETMMEEVSLKKINEEIDKLQKNEIPHNDFLDNLKKYGQESEKIRVIFDTCQLTTQEFDFFRDPCKRLYSLTGYSPDKASEMPLFFYSFRNQMTHTFRSLHEHPEEVAETVQGFEIVIMIILEKYK